MEWFARSFIQASLVWLALGVTVGVGMAVHPAWTIYRPIHMHMTLLGFVTMMIYGVAYHVLPRFAGNPLWSKRLGGVHVWCSNVGLALMAIGFGLRVSSAIDQRVAAAVLDPGAVLSAAGAYIFAYNLWRTIGSEGDRRARLTAIAERVRAASA